MTANPNPMLVDLSAERAVLGTIIAGAAPVAALDELPGAAFADLRHQAIRAALAAVRDAGAEVADSVLVGGALARLGTLGQAGGPAYLADLVTAEASPESLPAYSRIVLDRAERRSRLAHLRSEAVELLDPTRPLEDGAVRSSLGDVWGPLGSLGNWLDVEPPRRTYLLGAEVDGKDAGILALGDVGLLVAPGSAGKSWALVSLALAVATGRDWLGFRCRHRGRVLLALAEEDATELQLRLYHAAQLMRLTAAEREAAYRSIWPLGLAGRSTALTAEQPAPIPGTRTRDPAAGLPVTPVYWELLRRLEEDGPWAAVLLDPLSRLAGPEAESDNAQATRFIQSLERLARVPGTPTVLCAHHTAKLSRRLGPQAGTTDAAQASTARGASALVDGPRWVATLEPLARVDNAPELVRLATVKSNHGRYAPDTYLVRDPDRHGALRTATQAEYAERTSAMEDGQAAADAAKRARRVEAVVAEVVEAVRSAAGPIGAKALRERVGRAKGTVDAAVDRAAERGLIEQSRRGGQVLGWVLRTEGDRGGLGGGLVPMDGGGLDSPLVGSPSPRPPADQWEAAVKTESRSPSAEVSP